MPLLNKASLEALQAKEVRVCGTCGHAVRPNYCRQCDQYFEAGHMGPGVCPDAIHDIHRTY